MRDKIALQVEWPDFEVHLATCITNYEGVTGSFIRLAVTYNGETREKLMTCDEFARVTGFDEARKLMSPESIKGKKVGRA